MRIVVVGSGGREHALAWKLSQEAEVVVSRGNPGIAREFECESDLDALCERFEPDLVAVGPEAPLIEGLADRLRAKGLAVYGPGEDGARHEGSKAFSKALMARAGVPTAVFRTFEDPSGAKRYAEERYAEGKQLVVKASGAAMGKGAILPPDLAGVFETIEDLMVRKTLGEAGATVVLEERLMGREFSLMSVCNGPEFVSLPVAQDYKRVGDGDTGPNTGGMGSVCPADWVTAELIAKTEERLVAPILRAMREAGIDYRGTLFTGAMAVDGEPYCIEYNVRFGDPEIQSIAAAIGDGFAELLLRAARGEPLPPAPKLERCAVSVVLASAGYPGEFRKGDLISLPTPQEDARYFFAGVGSDGVGLLTQGGRVLAATGVGTSVAEARTAAYRAAKEVSFEGMQYRKDIAL